MKKTFLLVIATAIPFLIFAQLKVETSGIVDIGSVSNSPWPPSPTRDVTLHVFGPNSYNSGGKIAIGDVGTYHPNVGICEYGTTDSDQLQLHGRFGTFFTTGQQGTYVAMKIENDKVYVTNQLYSQGLLITSDKRLKTNIRSINDVSGLMKLKPVSFQYTLAGNQNISKDDNIKKNNTLKEAKTPNDKIGFIAQEVQEIYPQLVHEDANGMLSVDYVSMIPLLVETYKMQQGEINELEEELNKLKEDNNAAARIASNVVENKESNIVELFQNVPNPFKEKTTINFSIAPSVSSAVLYVYNLQGEQLKKYAISSRGKTSIEISANELKAGLYYYAIVYDGNISSTKSMVITE